VFFIYYFLEKVTVYEFLFRVLQLSSLVVSVLLSFIHKMIQLVSGFFYHHQVYKYMKSKY